MTDGASTNGTVYSSTTTVKSSVSYGKGTQILFAAGTMINANMGLELGVNYLAGAKYTSNYIVTGSNGFKETSEYVSSMLRLCPTLVMTTGKGNVKPYVKTGLVVGVSPKIKEAYTTVSDNGDNNRSRFESTGNVSLGFTNSLGIKVGLSNSLSFFGEFNIVTQAWSPKKRMITESTQNGVDGLPNLPNYYKETDYVSTVTTGNGFDSNVPRQSTKISYAFSSMGLNVGLHMSLGGKGDDRREKKKK